MQGKGNSLKRAGYDEASKGSSSGLALTVGTPWLGREEWLRLCKPFFITTHRQAVEKVLKGFME